MPTADTTHVGDLAAAAAAAAALTADGDGYHLVVLGAGCPAIPGEQGDDGVRAAAAIDVLRHLVDTHDADHAR